ncbi:MAG: hypothetical protein WAW91_01780 [Candidatus Nanoperiomorbaceae bacterium]
MQIKKTEFNGHAAFRKSATTPGDLARLTVETSVYRRLKGNPHAPQVYEATPKSLTLECIEGESLADYLQRVNQPDVARRPSLRQTMKLLDRYVAAETALLADGVLYRDLNLQHVIFTGQKTVMIDFEASLIQDQPPGWVTLPRARGTWEDMAPEEFVAGNALNSRTASYRVAVVAHLMLTGHLPFRHGFKNLSQARRWRLKRPLMIDRDLPKAMRKTIAASLQIEPAKRHKNPKNFFQALQKEVKL